MKKIVAAMAIFAVVIVAGLFGVVLSHGPRMKVQQHLRTFQIIQPPPLEGSLPVELPESLSAAGTDAVINPLPDTRENRSRGRVYYQYYCVFCHGTEGGGNGPVGESYLPAPADLRRVHIARYSDGKLLRAMLLGIGHEPVLEKVVPPGHRWHLVLYVRTLGR